MKKRLCTVLCAATILLTGCGAVELTDSESDLIAEYAATVLLKYSNTYQPKLQDEVIETIPNIYITPTAPADISQNGQGGQISPNLPVSTEAPAKNLSEAVGIAAEGFEVEYAGYEVTNTYPNTGDAYFAMRATQNKRLLVMKFDITNRTGEEKECDILSKERTYRCRVNDTERFGAQLTMLLDDLASFKEVFAANETKQAVLIFQIPAEYEGTITTLDLTVRGEGESNSYSYHSDSAASE
ncbi:MAG: hypothetical protein OSJ62_07990 [Lachnospiraceae bacterium]|nr:hypothetical protein [Lachnospiraceae bacterium]